MALGLIVGRVWDCAQPSGQQHAHLLEWNAFFAVKPEHSREQLAPLGHTVGREWAA